MPLNLSPPERRNRVASQLSGEQGPEPVISPRPEENQVDRAGVRSGQEEARKVLRDHVAGLNARRRPDLVAEKLMLHIDGSGDFQWADIYYDQKVEIPRGVSEYRKTENILRLLVDNAVAHHTTMPFRFFAETQADRRAQEKAMVDTIWANHLSEQQDLNNQSAEALYMAMATGFCPIHGYWRDDVHHDWYEPVRFGPGEESDPDFIMESFEPPGGMIDIWTGNPFDTVFNKGATKDSIQWCSYGRILDADMVRRTFPNAANIEGSTRIPSAAEFQRIARNWQTAGLGAHGSPVLSERRHSDEELVTVIVRETAPGVLPDWPKGRLTIIAVPGDVDLRRGKGATGHAVLLADQPLPGGDFSFSLFYSHHRGSDVHGKPWAEDLDQLQVDLNIALSKRWEAVQRMFDAPIITPGGAIAEDMVDIGGYKMLEVEPSVAGWRPQVMQWPTEVLQALDNEVAEKRQALYTQGGYQAASRGEAPGSRMAYRAIVALQEADQSIHGPVNQRFQRSLTDFMKRCWRQMKQFADVPWIVNIVGDEYAHLSEPYVDRTKLSEHPPKFKIVNAFGSSPEMRAQEIIELMQTQGADGVPFLRTDEARKQYPDRTVFDDEGNPAAVARRRAKTVAAQVHHRATQIRREHGIEEMDPQHPMIQQAAQQVFQWAERRYPRLRDDDLNAHLSTLSEVTQDETADPIARLAAQWRQDLYYQWQMMMAQGGGMPSANGRDPVQPGAQPGGGTANGGGRRTGRDEGSPSEGDDGLNRRQVAADAQEGGGDRTMPN